MIGIPSSGPIISESIIEPEVPTGEWGNGVGNQIDGLSLVVLTVSNTNNILDDGWDFKIDGASVANYDGGGDTILTFHAYYQPGETHELTAECVFEQSDNYFEVYVDINGERQITTSVGGDGTLGEIQELGTFTT